MVGNRHLTVCALGLVCVLLIAGCERKPPRFPPDATVVAIARFDERLTLPAHAAAVVLDIVNREPDSYVQRSDLTATAADVRFLVADVSVEFFGSLSLRDNQGGKLRGRWYWRDERLEPLWQELLKHYDQPLDAVRQWSDTLAAQPATSS